MLIPILFCLSSFVAMAAFLPPDGTMADGRFLAASLAAALSLLLLLRAAIRARRIRAARRTRVWVVIDGSNVMHWGDGRPSMAALSAVLGEVQRVGLTPLLWFDANAGYELAGRYMNETALSRALGLAREQVRVAPKGTPADPLILRDAVALQTGVITNDRYRDWADRYPSVTEPGVLLRGRVDGGAARIDWPRKSSG